MPSQRVRDRVCDFCIAAHVRAGELHRQIGSDRPGAGGPLRGAFDIALLGMADKDIAKGRARVANLEKKAGAKAKLEQQTITLQGEVTSAEARMTEMKQASAKH